MKKGRGRGSIGGGGGKTNLSSTWKDKKCKYSHKSRSKGETRGPTSSRWKPTESNARSVLARGPSKR